LLVTSFTSADFSIASGFLLNFLFASSFTVDFDVCFLFCLEILEAEDERDIDEAVDEIDDDRDELDDELLELLESLDDEVDEFELDLFPFFLELFRFCAE